MNITVVPMPDCGGGGYVRRKEFVAVLGPAYSVRTVPCIGI